jgi:hypothetical protein
VIDVVKEPDYIDLNEPLDAGPDAVNGVEGRVARASRTEAVAVFGEHRLVNPLQDVPDHFLHQSVVDRWNPERA